MAVGVLVFMGQYKVVLNINTKNIEISTFY